MIINPINPDVRSVLAQIYEDEIDLDPEFQRGDVWNLEKRQMLIDTILRNWKIPPIFFIKSHENAVKEVLDGHQRLQSIKLFYEDKFKIDGLIEPITPEIHELHGLTFSQLPDSMKYRFRSFPLNTFEISGYKENEPYELFYRLNTNVVLTSAERRNTFFGPARDQVKNLVSLMTDLGFGNDSIGFNNTRLGYHDIIARLFYALELSSIKKKINDKDITERFRNKSKFPEHVVIDSENALKKLHEAILMAGKIKFNKASLFSMLLFLVVAAEIKSNTDLADFICLYRDFLDKSDEMMRDKKLSSLRNEYSLRISTSVYDSKSVMFRHFCFCFLLSKYSKSSLRPDYIKKFESTLDMVRDLNFDEGFYHGLDVNNWGAL